MKHFIGKIMRGTHRTTLIFIGIGILHIFFRFYNLELWAKVGWDQMDHAWAATRILYEHSYPLQGIMAKYNSGITVGPLYYYFVALFYYFTRFDPIASPIVAGVTSILSFLTLYCVVRSIHGVRVALIASFIYAVFSPYIAADRMQLPTNFIPMVSFLIFYALYRVMLGTPRYILLLAAISGLSLHFHFTSVFYPIMAMFALPFFPRKRETLGYLLVSVPIFGIFLLPQAIYDLQVKTHSTIGATLSYLQTYYHGFHLRRMLQLLHDAVIEFEIVLGYRWLRPVALVFLPLYSVIVSRQEKRSHWFTLTYLIVVWIIVPWVSFTLYSGEITSYYFSSLRFIAIMMAAYLTLWFWDRRLRILQLAVVIFWGVKSVLSVQQFFQTSSGLFPGLRASMIQLIQDGKTVPFKENDVYYYLYYIDTTVKGIKPIVEHSP